MKLPKDVGSSRHVVCNPLVKAVCTCALVESGEDVLLIPQRIPEAIHRVTNPHLTSNCLDLLILGELLHCPVTIPVCLKQNLGFRRDHACGTRQLRHTDTIDCAVVHRLELLANLLDLLEAVLVVDRIFISTGVEVIVIPVDVACTNSKVQVFVKAGDRHFLYILWVIGVDEVALGGSLKGHHVCTTQDRTFISNQGTSNLLTPRLVHTGEIDQRLLVLEAQGVGQTIDTSLNIPVDLGLKHTLEGRLAVLNDSQTIKQLYLWVLLNQEFD